MRKKALQFTNAAVAAFHRLAGKLLKKKPKEDDSVESISKALTILVPGLRDMNKAIKKTKKLSSTEEIDAIEALLEIFEVIKMIDREHGPVVKEIVGNQWFKNTCTNANLIYDKAIAFHVNDWEGLLLKYPSGHSISLQDIRNSNSRGHNMKDVFASMKSLIDAVYQLEKASKAPRPAVQKNETKKEEKVLV